MQATWVRVDIKTMNFMEMNDLLKIKVMIIISNITHF